ncbi:MAG TPA: DNA sulfur modification protein DndB, partial [Rhodanobacter sp.]|nr:DNA sulfur modification protein DndB [Rhodanobacter sp.]
MSATTQIKPLNELVLPALRATFGDWVYYSATINASELVARVRYAEELHKSQPLSEWIQRQLEGDRAVAIAKYLEKSQQRFFNSLVLAVYNGDPNWIGVGDVTSLANPELVNKIHESAANTIGFLRLSGQEDIFALDGQHRLAGIKEALKTGVDLKSDLVPVIMVAHKETVAGKARTRRLFTTLNKTAVPVSKRDIIALDEDDVMAIVARRLVEDDPRFAVPRISLRSQQNMPVSDGTAFTTIGTLYDCLFLIFRHTTGAKRDELRFNRPPDAYLDDRYNEAKDVFTSLASAFPALKRYFASASFESVISTERNDNGGHLLFRPVGLYIVIQLAIRIANDRDIKLSAAIGLLRGIPTKLSAAPYLDVIWDN